MLHLRQLTKSFGGTAALKPLNLSIAPGEFIGLIGENGAGKSTLIKLLSGVLSPDAGEFQFNSKPVTFKSPQDATRTGIATIHQELAYFERLTVTENLLLSDPASAGPVLNWTALHSEASRRLQAVGLDLDPTRLMQSLTTAQRQEVAIARALSTGCKLLILDEPTASLTEPEVERLQTHLRRLHSEGVAILYVSHRLDEILQLTQRVLVLRDGSLVADYPTTAATVQRMVSDMVGRDLQHLFRRQKCFTTETTALRLQNLTKKGLFDDITMEVRAGEIVGLGLVGAGRSELGRCLFGLYPADSGFMELFGGAWQPRNPGEALEAGVAYVPEERKRQGLVLEHSVRENISIGLHQTLSRFGIINSRKEQSRTAAAVNAYTIKTASAEAPIGSLSGGNQQKALLARWLEGDPRLVILDEPTRGVDVGAKLEIYKLIENLASQGKAILLISSDLPELLALSDRIYVLYHGKIAAQLQSVEATQEKILLAASGL